MLEDKPLVEPVSRITRDDMVWAKELFQRHDPRKGAPDTLQTLTLSEEEVNRLLNYAVVLKPLSAMSVDLMPQSAQIQATLKFRPNPFGRYLNILAEVEEDDGKLGLASLRVGDVPFPSWLAAGAAWLAQTLLRRDEVYASLADAVHSIRLSENELMLDYRWQPELLTRLERRSARLLVSDADRERLLHLFGPHHQTTAQARAWAAVWICLCWWRRCFSRCASAAAMRPRRTAPP